MCNERINADAWDPVTHWVCCKEFLGRSPGGTRHPAPRDTFTGHFRALLADPAVARGRLKGTMQVLRDGEEKDGESSGMLPHISLNARSIYSYSWKKSWEIEQSRHVSGSLEV